MGNPLDHRPNQGEAVHSYRQMMINTGINNGSSAKAWTTKGPKLNSRTSARFCGLGL
jgi:hypothetical protein